MNWKDNNIPEMTDIEDTSDENIDVSQETFDPNFRPETSSEPLFIRQVELHDFVRELGLTKQQTQPTEPEKILLLPLHNKLELIKNFVKAMD
ncbi:hypothetical protein AVEN_54789-1 [Araneus ventricosus]|uniref:Uncharacterized protein n=1 Tax=Araneus ventricosus TaxID=182803 RepID=A0A4Y2W5Q0_ARAVE|nr:hypothetical protein AVEN_54789-1 [Araneus ventricosus]